MKILPNSKVMIHIVYMTDGWCAAKKNIINNNFRLQADAKNIQPNCKVTLLDITIETVFIENLKQASAITKFGDELLSQSCLFMEIS